MATTQNSVHLVVTKEVPQDSQERWLKLAEDLSVETWNEEGCIKSEHFKRLVPAMDALSSTVALDLCTPAVNQNCVSSHFGKVLVLYDSSSGCTEQMADFVAEGALLVGGAEVRIRSVPGEANSWDPVGRINKHPFANYDDIYWADGIACGSPTNLGCVSWRMKKFWDDFSQSTNVNTVGGIGWGTIDGKIGCSFTSQGGHAGGGELVNQAMNVIMMNFGMSVFGITDYVSYKQTMHYGAVCAKAPRDELDRMPCIRQGMRLAELVGLYVHGRQELHPLRASKAVDIATWGHPGIPLKSASIEKLVEINRRPFEPLGSEKRSLVTQHKKKVLIYTRMLEFVHGSTPAAAAWVAKTCEELGWEGVISDDPALLESSDSEPDLQFDLIMLVNNSGEMFDPQRTTLFRHVEAGRGVLGIHGALASFLATNDATGTTLTQPTTPIVETVFKAHFTNHPPVQTASVVLNPDVAQKLKLSGAVPAQFAHTDEFFNYTTNPALDPNVQVLSYVNEKTYEGGLMGEKHPVAWCHKMGECQAPIFYCALGHFSHFYNGLGPPHVVNILRAGMRYCGDTSHITMTTKLCKEADL